MSDLHVYELDDGESHWYAAESDQDALSQHRDLYREDPAEPWTIEMIPDYQVLTIEIDGVKTAKPAGEWAASRGLIGSTCF